MPKRQTGKGGLAFWCRAGAVNVQAYLGRGFLLFFYGRIPADAGETVGHYEVKDVPLSGKAEASGDQSFTLKDGAVQVFDNDKITIAYTGIETDGEGEDAETCLAFEIYNKTDELIQATFDTILVNGTDEEPSYMTEALGHTYGKLLCDVTDPASIKELTASVSIYTAEDELIDSYSIEKAALK